MRSGSFDPPGVVPQLWDGVAGDYAWDVGCSVGNTMAELMGRFSIVIGFEPSELAIEYLRTIPPVHGARVFYLAISDHDGKVELDLEEGHRKVACRSLDSLTHKLGEPNFIKVDVSGHEVQVLQGAEFLMVAAPPEWLIEIYSCENGIKCEELLSKYGYYLKTIVDTDDTDPQNHYWIRASISPFPG